MKRRSSRWVTALGAMLLLCFANYVHAEEEKKEQCVAGVRALVPWAKNECDLHLM